MPSVVSLSVGRFLLRPITPSDKAALASGVRALSEESRYLRFLAPKPRLTAAELRYLTEVDGVDHVAIVATPVDDPARIVGVARFVRDAAAPTEAETAVVVCDALQGGGLGGALGLAVVDAAHRRGILRLTATFAPGNVRARRLFAAMTTELDELVAGAGARSRIARPAAA